MNIQKNARTMPQSRALLVHRVVKEHCRCNAVAIAFGVSQHTVYKWLARYRAEGLAGLSPPFGGALASTCLGAGVAGADRPIAPSKLVATEIAERVPIAHQPLSVRSGSSTTQYGVSGE